MTTKFCLGCRFHVKTTTVKSLHGCGHDVPIDLVTGMPVYRDCYDERFNTFRGLYQGTDETRTPACGADAIYFEPGLPR